jgi:hypothetical protein
MAGGNSITFRMGGDLSGLKKDMAEAEGVVSKSAARAKQKMDDMLHSSAPKNVRIREQWAKDAKAQMDDAAKSTAAMTGKSGGAGGKGGGAGGHGGNSMAMRETGDILDGLTGQKGWVMKMQILKASLPIAALAGLALGFAKVAEAVNVTKEATKGATEELSKIHTNTSAHAGPEAAAKGFEELGKQIEKVKDSRGILTQIGDMATGGKAGERSIHVQHQMEEQRVKLAMEFSAHTREQIADREKAYGISEREFELVKARQAAEEKKASIIETAPQGFAAPQLHAVDADLAREEASINHKADAQQAEAQLEANILAAKVSGRDVTIQEAVDRLSYAQKIYEAAENDQAADIAYQKVKAAAEGVTQAERETAERKRGLATETELAGIIGDADSKHMAALMAEGQEIATKIADPRTKADEREKLTADQAKNTGAQRDAATAAGLKAFDVGSDIIDAHKGAGAGEEQLALLRKIELEKSKLAFMDASGAFGSDAITKQNGKLAEMGRQYEQIQHRREEAGASANNENDVLDEQLRRHEAVGEALRSQFSFAEKIKQATRDGNTDLAEQLRTQKALTLELQIQKLQRTQDDRSKATISELATHAHNQAGAQAREVERLEKRAEAQRKQGHAKEAAELQGRADKIRKAGGPDPRNPEAQKLQGESDRLRRQGHVRDANRLQDQADKLRQGTSPLKDSEKQAAIAAEQLTELKGINAQVGGLRNAR